MRAETALTSAPNSHGACHDLALGPVPTQNARLEEREGVPPTPARARAIRSPAPTEPPSSRSSPTTINPPQARAARALQVSQAPSSPGEPNRYSSNYPIADPPVRSPRAAPAPPDAPVVSSRRSHSRAWRVAEPPRAVIAHPRTTAARLPALRSPSLSKQGHLGQSRFPSSPPPPRLTRASPFSSPTTRDGSKQQQQRVERRRRVRGAVHGAGRAGGCRDRRILGEAGDRVADAKARVAGARSSRRKTFRIRVARRSIGRAPVPQDQVAGWGV